MKKINNYLKSFWKYYILRNPKLILTIILTIVVYIWIASIINNSSVLLKIEYLRIYRSGIFILFIKPIFIYISGLIIIKRI